MKREEQEFGGKEFHIQSALIFLFSNPLFPRNQIQVRKVNFSSERVQSFSVKVEFSGQSHRVCTQGVKCTSYREIFALGKPLV